MDDLLIRLRIQVERATEPIDPSEVRTHRRPRPRVLTVAVVGAALVAVVRALSIRAATHETTPSTIARGSGPDQRGISLERVDVHTGPDGTQEITFVFDGPLPDLQVAFIDDIASIDTTGVAYTVQGPLAFRVCQCVHSDDLAVTGSVDVLIPSQRFALDTTVQQLAPRYDPPIDSGEPVGHLGHPAKIVRAGLPRARPVLHLGTRVRQPGRCPTLDRGPPDRSDRRDPTGADMTINHPV